MSKSRDVQSITPIPHQGSIIMLPFFLLSYLINLSYVLAADQDNNSQRPQAVIPNRYSEYGWNRNAQQCYTEAEIVLLQHINAAYKNLLGKQEDSEFFQYAEESAWHDWWRCTKPLYKNLMTRLESGVFTLPSREKLDTKVFPLSNFAENMAKQIANWQAARSKNQPIDRMNDPAMLMFEQLKSLFLTDLMQQECRTDALDIIAKNLSYIKTLIHLIPDFELDKPHLIEIQRSLDHASSLIKNCIANKELPQLSSDVGRATDNFVENALNTLHFLGINEPVTDNFSIECLENKYHSQSSPICKIYKAAQNSNSESTSLYNYQGLHQFYNVIKISDEATPQIKLSLRADVASDINFASFFTEQDKSTYVEVIATLDALINVRKILDKFHHLQSKLGTYVFAVNYIDKANELATHYIRLINKTKLLIKSLVTASDDGHEQILRSHDKSNKHTHFKKNLRTLETLVVAKGTTVTSQLESGSAQAADSMAKYQRALSKLASDVNSGYAFEELKIAMQELDLQMRYMNTVLPGMLGEMKLTLDEASGVQLVLCAEDENVCSPKLVPALTAQKSQISPPVMAEASPPVSLLNTAASVNNFNLFSAKQDEPSTANPMFDYGQWDAEIDRHPRTNAPVFTYRLYKDGDEVGAAKFYNEPNLCLGENGRNNIIETTGILTEFHTDGMTIEETCLSLPPELFDQIVFAAGRGALRGTCNVIAATLKTYDFSDRASFAISQTAYYGATFCIKFSDYYQKLNELQDSQNAIDALYYAAIETGQLLLINATLNAANYLLTSLGNFFESYDWIRLGRCIKHCGSLIRFGFYAANTSNMLEAGAEIMTGAAVEKITETTGNYLLGNP